MIDFQAILRKINSDFQKIRFSTTQKEKINVFFDQALQNDDILKAYNEINNENFSVDLLTTRKEITEIKCAMMENVYQLPKILHSNGIILYNGIFGITEKIIQNFLRDENNKFHFYVIFLHELAHSKRLQFTTKKNFFDGTPEKYDKEAGEFLERKKFGCLIDFDALEKNPESLSNLSEPSSWKNLLGRFKERNIFFVEEKENKERFLYYKKKNIRCDRKLFNMARTCKEDN